ncbi:MAG: YciI family protein [Burkholderiaceae bacterium]
MKYLCLVYLDERRLDELPDEECVACDTAIRQSGHYLDCNRLLPPDTASTVRVRNGRVSATDGPWTETRDQLGGYYLIDARDLNEAIQVASRIPAARFGCVEVRPVAEDRQTLQAPGVGAAQAVR